MNVVVLFYYKYCIHSSDLQVYAMRKCVCMGKIEREGIHSNNIMLYVRLTGLSMHGPLKNPGPETEVQLKTTKKTRVTVPFMSVRMRDWATMCTRTYA